MICNADNILQAISTYDVEKLTSFADCNGVEIKDNQGNTPILCVSFACQHLIDHSKLSILFKMLIELKNIGADINAKNNKGQTALHVSIAHYNIELAELLLSLGADPEISLGHILPIHMAIITDSILFVKLLIRHGADPNSEFNKFRNDFAGYTILHYCVTGQSLNMIKLLLENKADPNINRADDGYTSLFQAVLVQNVIIIELLLEYHANPNIQASEGHTVLHIAIGAGSLPITQLLLSKGANPNIENYDGYNSLLIAAEHHNIGIIRLLLIHGALLKFNDFYTLEQVLTSNENDTLDLIKSLITDEISPIFFVLKNKDGFSLLDLAKETGRQEIICFIEQSNKIKQVRKYM